MTIRNNSKQVRPDSLGTAIFDPTDYQVFSSEDETVVGVYSGVTAGAEPANFRRSKS
ncbi:MAG TPA: hypothetical protein VGK54_04755 [Chloroflexota bacterium]